jgi:hypothetical protein
VYKNAGVLTKVTSRNGPGSGYEFHAASETEFSDGSGPTSLGLASAALDSGRLLAGVYLPGSGAYAGATLAGLASMRVESIFERPELSAP